MRREQKYSTTRISQPNSLHSRKIFDRLVEATESRGETLATVSKAMGLHLSSFYRWKKGSMPQDRTIRQVATHLGIREAWLRDGEGERDAEAVVNRLTAANRGEAAKDADEKERLSESSAVFRPRRALLHNQVAALNANAAAAKRSEADLNEVMRVALERIHDEKEPLMKLGYIATMRTVLDEMERRLTE